MDANLTSHDDKTVVSTPQHVHFWVADKVELSLGDCQWRLPRLHLGCIIFMSWYRTFSKLSLVSCVRVHVRLFITNGIQFDPTRQRPAWSVITAIPDPTISMPWFVVTPNPFWTVKKPVTEPAHYMPIHSLGCNVRLLRNQSAPRCALEKSPGLQSSKNDNFRIFWTLLLAVPEQRKKFGTYQTVKP